MNSTNLTTTFELYKENSTIPMVQVQINVDYDPLTNTATLNKLLLKCSANKATLDVTFLSKRDLFGPMVQDTIASTDWRGMYQASVAVEINLQQRLDDNAKHGIAISEPNPHYLSNQTL